MKQKKEAEFAPMPIGPDAEAETKSRVRILRDDKAYQWLANAFDTVDHWEEHPPAPDAVAELYEKGLEYMIPALGEYGRGIETQLVVAGAKLLLDTIGRYQGVSLSPEDKKMFLGSFDDGVRNALVYADYEHNVHKGNVIRGLGDYLKLRLNAVVEKPSARVEENQEVGRVENGNGEGIEYHGDDTAWASAFLNREMKRLRPELAHELWEFIDHNASTHRPLYGIEKKLEEYGVQLTPDEKVRLWHAIAFDVWKVVRK
jgi:hypothetical protein